MPSEVMRDITRLPVTPCSWRRDSGHWAVPGRPADTEPRITDPRSRDEPGGKPPAGGVYACQRLSLTADGKASGEQPRSEPDSGNPTVRDRRGAARNVDGLEVLLDHGFTGTR